MSINISTMNEEKLIIPTDKDLAERERRLSSLKALVNKLAHDFNNSLAPFTGWFSLIKEECTPDSNILLYAQKGEDVARGVKNMLEEVMNSVKPERRFNMVEMALDDVIHEELAQWKKQVPVSVNLEIYEEISECNIMSDVEHWRRAISNLLNNARYGLALGGRLEVFLKKDFLSNERRRELGIASNTPWLLVVKDNGLGIPSEIQDKIFEPFFSTRAKNNALGLGLTHVHSLARLHGGQVLIESEVDKGTTVYVWFTEKPIKIDFTGEYTSGQSGQKQPVILGNKKVLLVDDDELVLEVLKAFLQKRNFNVMAVNNSKSALEIFKKRSDDFGLVISDIRMQGMNGVEFVENILKLNENIPILFISGEKDAVLEILMARLNKKFKLLKKPCTFSEFSKAIEEVLGQKA